MFICLDYINNYLYFEIGIVLNYSVDKRYSFRMQDSKDTWIEKNTGLKCHSLRNPLDI